MGIVLTSNIDIAATPEQVWDVLSDFDSYGQWSNFSRVTGTATKGSRLSIRMPGMAFRPYVTAAVPNQELEWSATIVTERFFVGRHTFTLIPNDDGTTRLNNVETFSGVSVRPFRRLFTSKEDDGYASFNRALKQRVETRPASA